jgi:hypothetical protein
MVQRAHHPGLVRQHGGDARVAAAFGRQDLEHDATAEGAGALELRQPDLAHAPDAQPQLEDVPAADAFACLQRALRPSLTGPCPYLL